MLKILISVICALLISFFLKSFKSNISLLFIITVSVLVLIFSSAMVGTVIDFIKSITYRAGIEQEYIKVILKCVGICILGDFVSGLCRDCGESTLALNTEFVCKCSIIVISLPVYADVFDLILSLWEDI